MNVIRYFDETDSIVFVVDAADQIRFEEAKEALKSVVNGLPKQLPILVFANKMDLTHAAASEVVARALELDSELGTVRSWRIQSCSARRCEGLDVGVRWILSVSKPK